MILRPVFVIIWHTDGLLPSYCITWDPHTGGVWGRTYCANTVASTQGAHKAASAQQHRREDSLRAVELIPDGLADSGHVRMQHHREQAGDINRHTRHRGRALPVVGRHRSIKLWIELQRWGLRWKGQGRFTYLRLLPLSFSRAHWPECTGCHGERCWGCVSENPGFWWNM